MDEKIPQLTLTPDLDAPKIEVETQALPSVQETASEMEKLSEAEQKAVLEFAEKINLSDSAMVMQYGAAAQKNVADFSESTLESVRSSDMGEIGDMVSKLVVELKNFSADEDRKGLAGLFKRAKSSVEVMTAKYNKVETNVDHISEQLENHQITLMKDIALLDQMYDKNLEYFKQLTMYILAGRQKLQQERDTTLAQLQKTAMESGKPEDAQKANDYANLCTRFEKKLHDLELTRVISLQMGPQIRMIQNNDTLMTEKIQTSLVNTIPLWKSQMVLSLGIHHSQQAIQAQQAVTQMTNELLAKNADMLKTATIETAKESERGIVDIETLQHTNEQLIATLDEVLEIQTEGAQKRREAESELRRIEGELKQKLLEVRG